MKTVTAKEIEDYLTNRLGGISVIDIHIEFPNDLQAFHIEGENDYYLLQDAQKMYHLLDGKREEKLVGEDPEKFLAHVIQLITNEDTTVTY
ncbi:hypothetical protein K5E_08970 [Enterococcus thailandicus]|uniref:Uncharacterized protein n=2 Tax=root TaxID=1 RepID=A0A1L8XNP0_ENTTH|nr:MULTISPECIES: hypothetical protein [Enterococcus]ASZ06748.1 hypothetical protein CK496_01940 [Enterococcus thailandicus]MDA3966272.1 hypothetical protein [Enterococcus thailandicus]MDK4351657.1 hypothetical protein [Enterococcus thailandicus]MDT2733592.1 hypothetical protein [Enterococcus thailandicus]MDT2750864.1 hypothetical protein [Enterococcus thailandicus]